MHKWFFGTTAKQRENFFNSYPKYWQEYFDFLNNLNTGLYSNFINQLNNQHKVDFKGNLYIPSESKEREDFFNSILPAFKYFLIQNLRRYNLELRVGDYGDVLTNYNNMLNHIPTFNKKLSPFVNPEGLYKSVNLENFIFIYEKYIELGGVVENLYESPEEIVKMFHNCSRLNEFLTKYYSIVSKDFYKHFNIKRLSKYEHNVVGMDAILNLLSAFCIPFDNSDGEYTLLLPSDGELVSLILDRIEQMLTETYQELIDKVSTFIGYQTDNLKITKVGFFGESKIHYFKKGEQVEFKNRKGFNLHFNKIYIHHELYSNGEWLKCQYEFNASEILKLSPSGLAAYLNIDFAEKIGRY